MHLIRTENRPELTAMRAVAAFILFQHGLHKVGMFDSMIEILGDNYGLPASIAVLVILIEFAAPIALFAGIGGRLAALAMGVVMFGALFFHTQHGLMMNWFGDKEGEGFAYHLLFLATLTPLILHGPGPLSLDRLIWSRFFDTPGSDSPRSAAIQSA